MLKTICLSALHLAKRQSCTVPIVEKRFTKKKKYIFLKSRVDIPVYRSLYARQRNTRGIFCEQLPVGAGSSLELRGFPSSHPDTEHGGTKMKTQNSERDVQFRTSIGVLS